MVRHLLFISFITGFFINSFSQITIQRENILNLNEYVLQATDNDPKDIHTEAGEDLVWDFADSLGETGERTFWLRAATALKGHEDFPDATLGIQEDGINLFIQDDTEKMDIIGAAVDVFGDEPITVKFQDYERIVGFPSTYNTEFTNNYTGRGSIDGDEIDFEDFDVDSIVIIREVTRESLFDSWGELITPYDTFEVVRQEVFTYELTTVYAYTLGFPIPLGEEEEREYATYSFWSDDEKAKFPVLEYDYDTTTNVISNVVWLKSEPVFVPEEPDFTVSSEEFCSSYELTVTDNSENVIYWNWDFGADAEPATAKGQGPHTVRYHSAGTKTIELVSGDGTSTSKDVVVTGHTDVSFDLGDNLDTICSQTGTLTLEATPAGGVFAGNGVSGNEFNPETAGAGDHTLIYEYTDEESGCSNTDTAHVVVKDCASLKENKKDKKLSLYPNPSNGSFTVTTATKSIKKIKIVDATGRVVKTVTPIEKTDSVEISLDKPKNGVYILEITEEDKHSYLRFVVQL